MVDDHGQLAVAGGQMPATDAPSPAGHHRSSVWVRDHISPNAMLAYAERHRLALWVVVLCFYLAAFNGQWRIQPDAALYLSIGRNLASGKGYTYLGQPNNLAYPGWPTVIAATFKIFGSDPRSLLFINALMLGIALATTAMVYRLFLLHSGRPTAVAMSVGVGLTKAFFCYGFELWSDMPFALGAMTALAGYEGMFGQRPKEFVDRRKGKKWIDGLFLVGGILFAGSMRPTIWPLAAAIGISIVVQTLLRQIRWRAFLLVCVVAAVIAGAVHAMAWHSAGAWAFGGTYEDYLLNRISGHSYDGVAHPFTANIRDLFGWAASDVLFQARLGPVCNALLSALVLGLGFSLFRYRLLWGFWFTLLLATIMVSQEALDRYFLPVLPLLVFAWWELLIWIYLTCKEWSANLALPRPTANLVFLGLILFGGLSNVTKVGGIIIQQRQAPFLARYDKGTFDVIPRFSKLLHEQIDDKAIVLIKAPYGRVTEYLSERYVTGALGTRAAELQNRRVLVVEPSDLATQRLLCAAGLTEGPPLFTVSPSQEHGPAAIALSLHSTHSRKP